MLIVAYLCTWCVYIQQYACVCVSKLFYTHTNIHTPHHQLQLKLDVLLQLWYNLSSALTISTYKLLQDCHTQLDLYEYPSDTTTHLHMHSTTSIITSLYREDFLSSYKRVYLTGQYLLLSCLIQIRACQCVSLIVRSIAYDYIISRHTVRSQQQQK